ARPAPSAHPPARDRHPAAACGPLPPSGHGPTAPLPIPAPVRHVTPSTPPPRSCRQPSGSLRAPAPGPPHPAQVAAAARSDAAATRQTSPPARPRSPPTSPYPTSPTPRSKELFIGGSQGPGKESEFLILCLVLVLVA